MSDRPVFRIDAPGAVPWGARLWALEASAGTGKTWTIERLALAYLAGDELHDPIAPDELVIVTFTRAATAEMQSRLRAALREAVEGRRLVNEDRPLDAGRLERLREALARFSQVRVSTIHGFAQRTLAQLGEPVGTLDDNAESPDVLESAIRDALAQTGSARRRVVRAAGGEDAGDGWLVERIRLILTNVMHHPDGEVAASAPSEATEALADVVEQARSLLATRRARRGIASYGDLLVRLAERLADPADRERVAATIGAIVIDEFQDTDSLQWEIFRSIAGVGRLRAFVVVGDPKQAIYGFRGGDVQVYREAVPEGVGAHLVVNRRSTAPLVAGANRAFAAFADGIGFGIPEQADPEGRLVIPGAPIRYVPVSVPDPPPPPSPGAPWRFQVATATSAEEVRTEVFGTLLPDYVERVVGRETIVEATGPRLVRYDDLCVIVATNAHAAQAARGLQARERPLPVSVIGGAAVTTSDAAGQWRRLLRALEEPAHPGSARDLALSWFGGDEPARVAREHRDESGSDPDAAARWLAPYRERLLAWHDAFVSSSRAEFVARVLEESGVLARIARRPLATRHLTDLTHLAELIAAREFEDLGALRAFLGASRVGSEDVDASSTSEGPAARRVAGDEGAVRVMTVHSAKGLEFPIVLLPYLSLQRAPGLSSPVSAYRVRRGDAMVTLIDPTASHGTFGAQAKGEKLRGEVARRTYVALTRARVRNVVWTWETGSRGGGSAPFLAAADLRRWAEEDSLLFEEITATGGAPRPVAPVHPRRLERAVAIPRSTPVPARLSYTAMAAHLHGPTDAALAPEPEPADSEGVEAPWPDVPGEVRSTVRTSARLGRVVHRVLEELDDPDPASEYLATAIAHAAAREGLVLEDSEGVTGFVGRAWRSSVGPLGDHARLGDHGRAERLVEMGFDLPLVGGDVGRLLAVVREAADDPVVAAWAAAAAPSDLPLAGVLTGSIDAVLALAPARDRFLVVDYKTNQSRVGGVEDGSDAGLLTTMIAHHYPLQAILYLVALHRFLRQRLEDYDYERHVAGAAYLFVQYMDPARPGSGVISMRPSRAFVERVSDELDGRRDV